MDVAVQQILLGVLECLDVFCIRSPGFKPIGWSQLIAVNLDRLCTELNPSAPSVKGHESADDVAAFLLGSFSSELRSPNGTLCARRYVLDPHVGRFPEQRPANVLVHSHLRCGLLRLGPEEDSVPVVFFHWDICR